MTIPRVNGWRGGDLRLLGVIWVATAGSVIASHDVMPDLVHTQFPVPLRVMLWVIPGVVAVLAAYRARMWQSVGFGLLLIPAAERMISYFIGWIVYGHESRLAGFIIYGAVVALVLRLTRRPEPVGPALPPPLDRYSDMGGPRT